MNTQVFCRLSKIAKNLFSSIETLDLTNKDLTSLSEGLNPHVEGYLDLTNKDLTLLPAGFNPNVEEGPLFGFNQ